MGGDIQEQQRLEGGRGISRMTEEELKEIKEAVLDCHTGMTYLLGNPRLPNADGYIVQINNHLEKVNGTITGLLVEQCRHDKEIGIIKEKQENVAWRVYKSLPKWMQAAIVLWLVGSLTAMGVTADYFIEIFKGN